MLNGFGRRVAMLSISHGVSIMAEPHPDRGGTGTRYQHVAPDPKGSVAGATVPLSEAAPAPPWPAVGRGSAHKLGRRRDAQRRGQSPQPSKPALVRRSARPWHDGALP